MFELVSQSASECCSERWMMLSQLSDQLSKTTTVKLKKDLVSKKLYEILSILQISYDNKKFRCKIHAKTFQDVELWNSARNTIVINIQLSSTQLLDQSSKTLI
jgi:hypothetical protein